VIDISIYKKPNIIEQRILELKLKHPLSPKEKIKLQKLQQSYE
tara:strand:+ start:24575 stop:24703 length:129 start_codon:yes stop_codon:yes gene_type:complete